MVVTFGKFKGKEVSDLPSDYLAWCVENFTEMSPRLRDAFLQELRRRAGEAPAPIHASDLEAELHNRVGEWYRSLAKDYHPDRRGGSSEPMAIVNDCRSRLLKALGLEPARS